MTFSMRKWPQKLFRASATYGIGEFWCLGSVREKSQRELAESSTALGALLIVHHLLNLSGRASDHPGIGRDSLRYLQLGYCSKRTMLQGDQCPNGQDHFTPSKFKRHYNVAKA